MSQVLFRFLPRWKEELVVTGPGGQFILDLPMGVFSACLPTQAAWPRKAPSWAHDLWPQVRRELEGWSRENNAQLVIDDFAGVYTI
jgi:hypothetical protein